MAGYKQVKLGFLGFPGIHVRIPEGEKSRIIYYGVISARGLFFSVSFFVWSLGILMIIDVLALFAAGRWRRSYLILILLFHTKIEYLR